MLPGTIFDSFISAPFAIILKGFLGHLQEFCGKIVKYVNDAKTRQVPGNNSSILPTDLVG